MASDAPGNPNDDVEERLETLKEVLEHNEKALVAQTRFDSVDELHEHFRAGEEVTLTLDVGELVTILGALEGQYTSPSTPLHLIDALALFIDLQEEHVDILNEYVEEQNKAMEEIGDAAGPGGMYQ